MKKLRFPVAVILLVTGFLFRTGDVLAQSPEGFFLREIAPCQALLGGFTSPPDADHEQPCKEPGLNDLLIRKFADQTYGVSLDYRDFSRSWARLFECSFTGIGILKAGEIVVSPIEENTNVSQGKACQILVKATTPLNSRNAAYTVEIGSGCEAVCSHPGEINSISLESRKSKPFSPSFDCKKATTPTEKSICLDWNLSELDFKVAELWYLGYGLKEDIPSEVQSIHKKWLNSRSQCRSNLSCIRDKYQQRIKELCNALRQKPSMSGYCQLKS